MLSGDRAVLARAVFAVREPPPPPMTHSVPPTMSSPAPMMGTAMH
jgi:hypothetical protein